VLERRIIRLHQQQQCTSSREEHDGRGTAERRLDRGVLGRYASTLQVSSSKQSSGLAFRPEGKAVQTTLSNSLDPDARDVNGFDSGHAV